jgi:hypothetical protein
MAHTMGRPLTAVLVVSLTVVAPSSASAFGPPHPPDTERFYCHRIVHPVAMHGYGWQVPNRAGCLPRPAVRRADSQTRPPAHSTS